VASGHGIREGRVGAGWTQRELAARLKVNQSTVCRMETARMPGVGLELTGRALEEVGARVAVTVDGPFVADRRLQRDAGHARCIAFIRRRLERAGWDVRQEVEVGEGRLRGWIDLLAFDPISAALLTSEFKSALPDVGAAERQLDWYQRHADGSARRFGWRPRTSHALLLLLASEANDIRVRENAAILLASLPGRATDFAVWIDDRRGPLPPRRGLAMVDPYDRHARWLRPTKLDGRRTRALYVDYADFMRRVRAGRSRA
jgi:transcriptional regulator with XRE-family HTH domain